MNSNDIYHDFKGYNAAPLAESEKAIRCRFSELIQVLIEKITGCRDRARSMGRMKMLSETEAVRKRMENLKIEIDSRDRIYVPPYLKEKISIVDEEKLREIDYHAAGLMHECGEIIDGFSCEELDLHIIDSLTKLNSNIRELEKICHERKGLLLKDRF